MKSLKLFLNLPLENDFAIGLEGFGHFIFVIFLVCSENHPRKVSLLQIELLFKLLNNRLLFD